MAKLPNKIKTGPYNKFFFRMIELSKIKIEEEIDKMKLHKTTNGISDELTREILKVSAIGARNFVVRWRQLRKEMTAASDISNESMGVVQVKMIAPGNQPEFFIQKALNDSKKFKDRKIRVSDYFLFSQEEKNTATRKIDSQTENNEPNNNDNKKKGKKIGRPKKGNSNENVPDFLRFHA